ncbi:hypothetical protein DXC51_07130 [Eisenbergiella massiliensis]|uniref:Uncharacterized protein n=1 Tax=Eisenbergiella massiliensis TaxID=1720294 RepID=A0A3E3I7E3_9FIRM|nr:hypothetical protein DXC51_07130 [Eisenbergiella massiliensis]
MKQKNEKRGTRMRETRILVPLFSSGQATWQRAKGHPHVRSLRQGKSGTAIFVDSMDIPILVFR